MKRNTTVFVICGLFLLADYICLKQTVNSRANLSAAELVSLVTAEALAAAILVSLAFLVVRKNYARQKKPAKHQVRFERLQPLRRLFVSVWS